MKTNICLWYYLADFFLEWKIFQTKVVEKIETHILCSVPFFSEKCAVYEIMWKSAEHATDDNIIRRMRFAYRTTKATNTHS